MSGSAPGRDLDLGPHLIRGLKEAIAFKRGELPGAEVTRALVTARGFEVVPPAELGHADVVRIRQDLGVSQAVFAQLLGASVATVRAWEQGVREPSLMARRLLELADREPDVFGGEVLVRVSDKP